MTKVERVAIVNNVIGRIEAYETAAKLFDAYADDLGRNVRDGTVVEMVEKAWKAAATDMRRMAKAECVVLQSLKEQK